MKITDAIEMKILSIEDSDDRKEILSKFVTTQSHINLRMLQLIQDFKGFKSNTVEFLDQAIHQDHFEYVFQQMGKAQEISARLKSEMDQMERKLKFLMEEKRDQREGMKHEEIQTSQNLIGSIEDLTSKVTLLLTLRSLSSSRRLKTTLRTQTR